MNKTAFKKLISISCVVFLLLAEPEREDHQPEFEPNPADFERQQRYHP